MLTINRMAMYCIAVLTFIALVSSSSLSQWSWRTATDPKEILDQISSMHFFDSQNGWAIGHHKSFFQTYLFNTTDGGNTWEVDQIREDVYYYELAGCGDFGILAGIRKSQHMDFQGRAFLKITRDGGKNWDDSLEIGPEGGTAQFEGVHCPTQDVAYVGGTLTESIHTSSTKNLILRTTDGGYSWDDISMEGSSRRISHLHFVDENTGWASGSNGDFWRTTDAGESWVELDALLGATSIKSMCFVDKDYGWIISQNSLYRRTTDGGDTWIGDTIEVPRPWPPTINALTFIDRLNGWLVGNQALIYRSTDGGVTWQGQTQVEGKFTSIMNVYFRNAKEGWATGDSFSIFHTDNGGLVDVAEDRYLKTPLTIVGIAPQPATDNAAVDFNLEIPGLITINIIDTFGSTALSHKVEVATSGPQRTMLDISSLAAGSYILRIDALGAHANTPFVKVQ